ncbi:MAG: hypothetical protein HYY06_14995 [Deltaproteobacteria bacterium]|nr:hypothetical protein [Deltaproteobacteria bacterium]
MTGSDSTSGNYRPHAAGSTDGGLTWNPWTALSDTGVIYGKVVSAVSPTTGEVRFAWSESTVGQWDHEIFVSGTLDGGMTCSPKENVSLSPGISWDPALAAVGDEFALAWSEAAPGYEIFFKQTTAGVWGDATNVSSSPDADNWSTDLEPNGDYLVLVYGEQGADRWGAYWVGYGGGEWTLPSAFANDTDSFETLLTHRR